MGKEKGLALIVVLWVVSLLTIMASSFTLTMQREAKIIAGIKESARLLAFAEAGINYAIIKLMVKDKEHRWQSFNSLYEIDYEGAKIRIQIADESGKIAINHAKKEQLVELLSSISVDETEADNLSDAILDWRDKNDLHRINGAEKQQYDEAGLKYGPRNAPFSNIEEVQMVLGMTADIYQQLEGMVSTYTDKPGINPTTASRTVLLTLPDATSENVNEYLQQRAENERNSEPVVAPDWYRGTSSKSNIFMIVAEAMIDKETSKQIMAVIRMSKSKDNLPFLTLKWTKDYKQPSLFLVEKDERVINRNDESK